MFENLIKPYFHYANHIFFLFDDDPQEADFDLKKTSTKRYTQSYDEMDLTKDTIVDDWSSVIKSPSNKRKLKRIVLDEIIQRASEWLEENQCIYLNGTFGSGIVKYCEKNWLGYVEYKTIENLKLRIGESDTKIFFAAKYLANIQGFKKILVYSLDTDVKILSLYFASLMPEIEIVIKYGSGLCNSYFYPKHVMNYYKTEFDLDTQNKVLQHAKNVVKAYCYFGNDSCPGFNKITHGYGLSVFNEMRKSQEISSENDFMKLILKVYEKKNKSQQHLFPSSKQEMSIEQRIVETRSVIKSIKCSERETIPIPGNLTLQYKRADFLCNFWIDEKFNENPADYGWIDRNGKFEIVLQDEESDLYKIPMKMMVSCSCTKNECKKCKCAKTKEINGKCSQVLCKSCQCYKRNRDSEEEDLLLSTEFQSYLDDLSSDEENEGESDVDDNLESPSLSDFDSDVNFEYDFE